MDQPNVFISYYNSWKQDNKFNTKINLKIYLMNNKILCLITKMILRAILIMKNKKNGKVSKCMRKSIKINWKISRNS